MDLAWANYNRHDTNFQSGVIFATFDVSDSAGADETVFGHLRPRTPGAADHHFLRSTTGLMNLLHLDTSSCEYLLEFSKVDGIRSYKVFQAYSKGQRVHNMEWFLEAGWKEDFSDGRYDYNCGIDCPWPDWWDGNWAAR